MAVNPTNGALNWFFHPQDVNYYGTPGDTDGNPVVGADGTIYFLAESFRLYAVSPAGNLKWFLPVPAHEEPDGSPCLGADGTIYLGSNSRYFYAVNSDGSLKWTFDLGNGSTIQSEPAIAADGTVYLSVITNYAAALLALNPDGSQKWVFTNVFYASGNLLSSPAIAADGTAYFGASDGGFYAVSNNGTLVWSTNTGGPIISSPAIGADGTVYVASENGNLYAFFGSAPLATNAPWPMFGKSPGHTGQQTPLTTPAPDCAAPFVYNGANDGTEFTFSIAGTTNSPWNVYASTDLTNWAPVGSVTLDSSTGTGSFQDYNVASIPQRFYLLTNNGCASRVIGFVTLNIVTGTNLIADQLCQVDDGVLAFANLYCPMNTLNDLFTPLGFGGPFDQLGTQIMKWNGQSFDVFTFGYNQPFGGIVWAENGMENGDATLLPGVGVLMNNVGNAPFTSTFIGLIREEQVFQIQAPTNSQPTINYLSATVPMAGRIPDITGYVPLNGDIIQLWNTTNRAYDSYSYISNTWPNGVPSVGAGEGFVLITSNAYIWTNSWQP